MAKGVKTGGRVKGTPNRSTREVRELSQRMVNDPRYLRSLRARLRSGDAGPIENLLWCYAYGRPAQADAVTRERVAALFSAFTTVLMEHVPQDRQWRAAAQIRSLIGMDTPPVAALLPGLPEVEAEEGLEL